MNDTTNNRDTIRRLLDNYYNGEIDDEAERTLRRLLRAPGLPEEFEADMQMFEAIDAEIEAPSWLRSKINADIAARALAEKPRRRWLSACAAAAAAVIISLVIPSVLHTGPRPQGTFAACSDEQAAIEALSLLANTVSKGCDAVGRAATITDDVEQKVDKYLSPDNDKPA